MLFIKDRLIIIICDADFILINLLRNKILPRAEE